MLSQRCHFQTADIEFQNSLKNRIAEILANVPIPEDSVTEDTESMKRRFQFYYDIRYSPMTSHHAARAVAYRSCCGPVEGVGMSDIYLKNLPDGPGASEPMQTMLNTWLVFYTFSEGNLKRLPLSVLSSSKQPSL
jgi:hypothetical protein